MGIRGPEEDKRDPRKSIPCPVLLLGRRQHPEPSHSPAAATFRAEDVVSPVHTETPQAGRAAPSLLPEGSCAWAGTRCCEEVLPMKPGEECGPQCQLSPFLPQSTRGPGSVAAVRTLLRLSASPWPCPLHAALGPTVRCMGLGTFAGLTGSRPRHPDDSTSGPPPIINAVKSPPFRREGYMSRPQVGML